MITFMCGFFLSMNAKKSFTRPKKVQKEVDWAFEKNSKTPEGGWGLYNGSPWYGILGIDEENLLAHLVSLGKKDIHIMDVGCGDGRWGHNIKRMLETKYKDVNTKFHIFSITGGKECQEDTLVSGNIILHQFNQFKVENIDEELAKRGFDLNDKIDIIISRWALRHLVDPFGTVDKLYGLLTPEQGKLLSNGFLFKLNNSDTVIGCPAYTGSFILAHSNATALFLDYSAGKGGDVGEFLLERNDTRSLNLPLHYTGSTGHLYGNHQCASDRITEFVVEKGDESDESKKKKMEKLDDRDRFCLDEQCKDLYMRLKQYGLFKQPPNEFV